LVVPFGNRTGFEPGYCWVLCAQALKRRKLNRPGRAICSDPHGLRMRGRLCFGREWGTRRSIRSIQRINHHRGRHFARTRKTWDRPRRKCALHATQFANGETHPNQKKPAHSRNRAGSNNLSIESAVTNYQARPHKGQAGRSGRRT
jgi:hypothetical protein